MRVRSAVRSLDILLVTSTFSRRIQMCHVRSSGKDRQGDEEYRSFHPRLAESDLVILDAHHITDRNEMHNGSYVRENGITLCDAGCHRLAELFHQTGIPDPGFSREENIVSMLMHTLEFFGPTFADFR